MDSFSTLLEKFEDTINSFISKNKDVSIFGAGSFGIKVYKELIKQGFNVIKFYDNDEDKYTSKIYDIPIQNPSNINSSSEQIVIASLFASEIAEKIRKNGYTKKLTILDPWYEMLNNKIITKSDINKLNILYSELKDQESKNNLMSIIQFRTDGTNLKSSKYQQYFHSTIFPENDDVIIDGGAFDGDLIRTLNLKDFKHLSLHCFEPDSNNFTKLQNEANLSPINIKTNKLGLWSCSEKLIFVSSDKTIGNGCKIDDKGDIEINTISIDEYVNFQKIVPTYIKLDVEGAEYQTIKGAETTIKNHKPKLAISLYHKYNDLWEIPNLIKSINPNYNFYLEHHTNNWYETILYAIEDNN